MNKGEQEWLLKLSEKNQITQVLQTNQYTDQFHLQLTREDVQELMAVRREELKTQERVEFGEGILKRLIFIFCDSPYLYQENYVEMLTRLQEIFYLYKNESMDECTDDELLTYMKEAFDGECHGDLDYLENTVLEAFARNIREKTQKFIGSEKML